MHMQFCTEVSFVFSSDLIPCLFWVLLLVVFVFLRKDGCWPGAIVRERRRWFWRNCCTRPKCFKHVGHVRKCFKTTTVESQSNKKSKISEKVKEHFEQLPSGKRQCKHCKAKYVIREEQNRLVSKTVQAVMCLKSWYAVLKREVISLDWISIQISFCFRMNEQKRDF